MSRKNEIELYYSFDAFIGQVLSLWGNCNFIIQPYVKQKNLRPKVYRYYYKNGNIIKA